MTEMKFTWDISNAIVSMAISTYNEGLLKPDGIEVIGMIHRQWPELVPAWFVKCLDMEQEAA